MIDAQRISQRSLIIYTHIDSPSHLTNYPLDISKRTAGGHFDYERASEGSLNLAFMVLYVPQSRHSQHQVISTAVEIPPPNFGCTNELRLTNCNSQMSVNKSQVLRELCLQEISPLRSRWRNW